MPTLISKKHCTGCTACASVCPKGCITMVADENGFSYPTVDPDFCINCGLCEDICPILSPKETKNTSPTALAAYTKDETVRLRSSSGGIFTELCRIVFEHGGAVFAAAYDENFSVKHICAEDETALSALQGAKYSQSDLRGIFISIKKLLDSGRSVLFAGTPCQVGGLISFLQKDYDNLITVDFVCHSIPSPMAWNAFIQHRAAIDNNGIFPDSINMRSKSSGWSRYRYSNLYSYQNGLIHSELNSESIYMKLFIGGYISRESCCDCSFKGIHRSSDITLGDFWGIWNIDPSMDDDKGTSFVMLHTPRGELIFNQISGKLVTAHVSIDAACVENPAIIRCITPNKRRNKALRLMREGKITACFKWFSSDAKCFIPILRQLYLNTLSIIHSTLKNK